MALVKKQGTRGNYFTRAESSNGASKSSPQTTRWGGGGQCDSGAQYGISQQYPYRATITKPYSNINKNKVPIEYPYSNTYQ